MHVMKLFDLTGKVALITGGSRGLGKEMAAALGEAGAKVAITARREQWLTDTSNELESSGISCLPLKGDVTIQEDVKRFVSEIVNKWGKIDILVNNAGIAWVAPPEEMPIEKWDAVMDTNIKGVFLFCQEVGKQMIKQDGGVIINISSTTGQLALDPLVLQTIGYQVSKGGVNILTKQLAVEWAPHNIRVNAIAPDFFRTRLTGQAVDNKGEQIIRRVPMRRLGNEGELKGIVVFLASDASSYITGQIICVDGGATA